MKKLLIGLLTLTSLTSFADTNFRNRVELIRNYERENDSACIEINRIEYMSAIFYGEMTKDLYKCKKVGPGEKITEVVVRTRIKKGEIVEVTLFDENPTNLEH